MKNRFTRLLAAVTAAIALAVVPAEAADVDLALVLLADVSGSISGSEYTLQKTGYVNAFNNPNVWNAIADGAIGSIAVTYVEWSGAGQFSQLVGWSQISDQTSSEGFASAINGTTRAFSGSTGLGQALSDGAGLFSTLGLSATRSVIDISGDGCSNSGISAAAGRQAAIDAGVDAINGLVIQPTNLCFSSPNPNVLAEYQNSVMYNGFVETADDFEDFGTALDSKIIREVQGGDVVPEPATMLLLGTGLLGITGVGVMRRRKEEAEGEDA